LALFYWALGLISIRRNVMFTGTAEEYIVYEYEERKE
jgi:hypothetical protein